MGIEAPPRFVVLVGEEDDAMGIHQAFHPPGGIREEFQPGLAADAGKAEVTHRSVDPLFLPGRPLGRPARGVEPAPGRSLAELPREEGMPGGPFAALLEDRFHPGEVARLEGEVGEPGGEAALERGVGREAFPQEAAGRRGLEGAGHAVHAACALGVVRVEFHPSAPPCQRFRFHFDFRQEVADAGAVGELIGALGAAFRDPREGLADEDGIAGFDEAEPGIVVGCAGREAEKMAGRRKPRLLRVLRVGGGLEPGLGRREVLRKGLAEGLVMPGRILAGIPAEVVTVVVGEAAQKDVFLLGGGILFQELLAGLPGFPAALPDLLPEAGGLLVGELLASLLVGVVALLVLAVPLPGALLEPAEVGMVPGTLDHEGEVASEGLLIG